MDMICAFIIWVNGAQLWLFMSPQAVAHLEITTTNANWLGGSKSINATLASDHRIQSVSSNMNMRLLTMLMQQCRKYFATLLMYTHLTGLGVSVV